LYYKIYGNLTSFVLVALQGMSSCAVRSLALQYKPWEKDGQESEIGNTSDRQSDVPDVPDFDLIGFMLEAYSF